MKRIFNLKRGILWWYTPDDETGRSFAPSSGLRIFFPSGSTPEWKKSKEIQKFFHTSGEPIYLKGKWANDIFVVETDDKDNTEWLIAVPSGNSYEESGNFLTKNLKPSFFSDWSGTFFYSVPAEEGKSLEETLLGYLEKGLEDTE